MTGSMRRVASRVFEALITLWLLATLCFALLRAAPGGPFDTEKAAPPEVQAALAAQYRLDRPLLAQYGAWIGDVARGDLGPSFQYPDYSVNQLVASALPVSALNGGLALLLALLLGIPLGIWSALRAGRWTDRVLMFVAGLGLAIPEVRSRAPAGAAVRGDAALAARRRLGRVEQPRAAGHRTGVAEPGLLRAPDARLDAGNPVRRIPARSARARPVGNPAAVRARAEAGLLPVVAWLSPALINVVTGSAVVEQVFGIPGMGRYFVQGALNRDYTLVLGVVLVVGALIVLINTLIDAVRGWLDPRLDMDA